MGQDCQSCIQVQLEKEANTQQFPTKYQKFIRKCLQIVKLEQGQKYISQIQQIGNLQLKNDKKIVCGQKFGLYLGEVNQKGKPEGKGKLIYRNYNMFQGQFKNQKPHGKGQFRDKRNLYTLKGEWQNGNFKSGKLIHKSGQQMLCENLKKLGIRKYYIETKLQNKTTYKGQIVQSAQQQKQDGALYVIEGNGNMNFPDGSVYSGNWCRGVMNGLGKYIWPDGSYYQGNYKNGLRDGKGKIFMKKQNKIYQGYWQKGELCIKSLINENDYEINMSSSQGVKIE